MSLFTQIDAPFDRRIECDHTSAVFPGPALGTHPHQRINNLRRINDLSDLLFGVYTVEQRENDRTWSRDGADILQNRIQSSILDRHKKQVCAAGLLRRPYSRPECLDRFLIVDQDPVPLKALFSCSVCDHAEIDVFRLRKTIK